jgi:hypothetical protein
VWIGKAKVRFREKLLGNDHCSSNDVSLFQLIYRLIYLPYRKALKCVLYLSLACQFYHFP